MLTTGQQSLVWFASVLSASSVLIVLAHKYINICTFCKSIDIICVNASLQYKAYFFKWWTQTCCSCPNSTLNWFMDSYFSQYVMQQKNLVRDECECSSSSCSICMYLGLLPLMGVVASDNCPRGNHILSEVMWSLSDKAVVFCAVSSAGYGLFNSQHHSDTKQ